MNRASHAMPARAVRRGATPALLAFLALLALVVAACGGPAAPAANDPYAVTEKALDASYDQLKVQVGIKTTGGDTDVSIDPSAIELVLDTKAGKGSLHLALPLAALGSDASSLQGLGIAGDSLDVDVLFDGQAVYAKSPLAATLLPMLLAQSGQTVTGDLTGWIRLGTAEEFAGLAGALGAMPEPSVTPEALPDLDATQLKSDLEASGIVVTYAGRESRNGVDSDHLTVTVDPKKLASGPLASQIPADRLGQLGGLEDAGTLAADIWLDASSGRPTEVDLHAASADGQKADITILLSTPGAAALEAPSDSTEVPLAPLLQTLMQMVGPSLTP